ncbi:MAG: peptide ABC transporter substrate-binding protein [Gemmatimonadaceae bacterium]|nr:peptide ABC transporter substrate-binding protein [Gemmatimonadaceae bacterium]
MASGTDLESGNPLVTIHPLSRQMQRHALFVTLLKLDTLLQPLPYLARSWQWSPDRTQLELALDSTLQWHDGAPTTAEDVRFTYDAVKDSTVGSPRRGDVASIVSVDAAAPYVVRVRFDAPQPRLPSILAELPIVPRHLLDSVPRSNWRRSTFATAPVGNGPFVFTQRVAGRQWRFERNSRFPVSLGGPPSMPGLVITVVDEASTKFAGLVSGELDIAGVSPAMAHLVVRDSALRLLTPPALFSTMLAFNTTRAPFNDARVRRAISLALDREQVVMAAVAGYATPALSAIPPGLPVSPNADSVKARIGTMPERRNAAERLLDDAGWRRNGQGTVRSKDGKRLAVTLLTVGSGDMAVEQLVQADLRAIGVDVSLRVMELATFLSTVRAADKTFDMVLTGIPGDIGLGHIVAMFDDGQRGGALDYTGFHSVPLTAAIRQARITDGVSQQRAWGLADSILQAEQPAAWLYHARGVQGIARSLDGVRMDLRGELATVTQWIRRRP